MAENARDISHMDYSDGYTAAEQSMWRSVEEELPPINEVVIASYIGFTFAYYDGTDWWAIDGDYIKPTKFMYIPSLPDTNTEKI